MSKPVVPDKIIINDEAIIFEKDGEQYAISKDYFIDVDVHIEHVSEDGFSRVHLAFYTDSVEVGSLHESVNVTREDAEGVYHAEAHTDCCGGKGYCEGCYKAWPCSGVTGD